MKIYGQDTKPLWDDAYTWQGSFLSFRRIERLLIRTSRSIIPEGTESEDGLGWEDDMSLYQRQQEDSVVRKWLVFPPPSLIEFRIWTKAFKGHTNGERMAVWMPSYNERLGRDQWQEVRDHPFEGKEVDDGSFI